MSFAKKRVLFLGEGDLSGPARYLAAILTYAGIRFDHVEDLTPIPGSFLNRSYEAIILSDYRYRNFSTRTESWVVKSVQSGTGLLMIGGWASFTGLVGHYAGSAIESLLPVRCIPGDDRVNWASGSIVSIGESGKRGKENTPSPSFQFSGSLHHPPMVCGYHRIRLRKGAQVLLNLRDMQFKQGEPTLGPPHPLLVLGQARAGRTAAFLTDCAPHWAGGFVDWGRRRITVSVAPTISVEVGDHYFAFFKHLLAWLTTVKASF